MLAWMRYSFLSNSISLLSPFAARNYGSHFLLRTVSSSKPPSPAVRGKTIFDPTNSAKDLNGLYRVVTVFEALGGPMAAAALCGATGMSALAADIEWIPALGS
jgi:hypothetical protein